MREWLAGGPAIPCPEVYREYERQLDIVMQHLHEGYRFPQRTSRKYHHMFELLWKAHGIPLGWRNNGLNNELKCSYLLIIYYRKMPDWWLMKGKNNFKLETHIKEVERLKPIFLVRRYNSFMKHKHDMQL